MPVYEYQCGNCEGYLEAVQGYHDSPLVTCPECKTDTLQRQLFAPTIFDATPKTLGSTAERNNTSLGKYYVEEQRAKLPGSKKPKNRAWWESDNDPAKLRA